ncbi:MAG: hypothetical protein KJ886_04450 [Candidatus Thermoplasmatota archaeon]|nr:hypothetical protein [Candidatus Thermoplasmatota archaeon]
MTGKKWVKGYYCPSCDEAMYSKQPTITNLSPPKVCSKCRGKLIKIEYDNLPLSFKLVLSGVALIIILFVLGAIFSIYIMILGLLLILPLIGVAHKIDKKIKVEVKKEGRRLIQVRNNKGYNEGKR